MSHGSPEVPVDRSTRDVLSWNPRWTAEAGEQPRSARLVAGTDRVLALDGVDPVDVDHLLGWCRGAPIVGGSAELVAHLVELGVLRPMVGAADGTHVRLELHGATGEEAAIDELRARSRFAGMHAKDADDADVLAVLVRRGTGEEAPVVDPLRPRLVVDVGGEHTVVLGPFVVPGRSACETCLDRLHARRWPTHAQPAVSGVLDHLDLVAALIDRHAELIAAGRSPLVNATIAFDTDAMTSRRDPLLMSPGCPTCAVVPTDGRLAAILEES